MRTQPARTLIQLVVAFAVIAGVFMIVWLLAPEAQPVLLLGALLATVALYVGMYVVQRRRHW